MKTILLVLSFFLFLIAYTQKRENNNSVIVKGQMPNIAKDKNNNIHIVYGSGDSIMYISSREGRYFTSPVLIAMLPQLFASAMRGPQIATGANGLVVTACTKSGNIFSYHKSASGKWSKAVKVNDENESAKEALMSLSAEGTNAFAVWLGVRNLKGQNIIGARSNDGGKTWKKNILVYASPDNSVCECCKPSVVMKGNNVYAMFRNWLDGNRDLYLIKSTNAGNSFGLAQKLGKGSWKLNGCPMDGGGLALNKKGTPETVWRRGGKIYAATPGLSETELGEGRSCSMEIINSKKIYTWTESGNVIVMKPNGTKLNLGKGSLPAVQALNNDHVVCVWENEKQIHASIVQL